MEEPSASSVSREWEEVKNIEVDDDYNVKESPARRARNGRNHLYFSSEVRKDTYLVELLKLKRRTAQNYKYLQRLIRHKLR